MDQYTAAMDNIKAIEIEWRELYITLDENSCTLPVFPVCPFDTVAEVHADDGGSCRGNELIQLAVATTGIENQPSLYAFHTFACLQQEALQQFILACLPGPVFLIIVQIPFECKALPGLFVLLKNVPDQARKFFLQGCTSLWIIRQMFGKKRGMVNERFDIEPGNPADDRVEPIFRGKQYAFADYFFLCFTV
jgi:hypothetical protein